MFVEAILNRYCRDSFVVFLVLIASAGYAGTTPRSATSQPVTIVEFADFQCPFCAQLAPDLRRIQTEYPGRVRVEFKNFPLVFHSRAKAAHLAALAAGNQGKFWEMYDLIFAHPGHLSDLDFDHYADQLGLNMDEFHAAIHSPSESGTIEKDIAEGQRLGVTGTPTLIIEGHVVEGVRDYAYLKHAIESELKQEHWWDSPSHVVGEGVEVKTEGSPSLGPESAAVTIVEFSDFECPFCARAVPALKKLVTENPGRVRLVYKNFPLDFHADSPLAHRAAAAAGAQGKFWEMHDLIFQHQREIKRKDLLELAVQLRLDMARFERDLADPDLESRIEADKQEGVRLGVNGTPTFVVNGKMSSGFSQREFQEMLTQELNSHLPVEASDTSGALPPGLDLTRGPRDAPIKIEWYVDLGSPLTPQSAVVLERYLAAHPGTVQVQFRNLPLPNREGSMLLHAFALAAAAQGKFWQTEALLLADAKPKDRNELQLLAADLGLDQTKLWSDIDKKKYESLILRDLANARARGVTGTPTFLMGDNKLDGVDALQSLDRQVNSQSK